MSASIRSKVVSCLVGAGIAVACTAGTEAWAQVKAANVPVSPSVGLKKTTYAPLLVQALESKGGKPLSSSQRDQFVAASKVRAAEIKAANDKYAAALGKLSGFGSADIRSILDNTIVPSSARVGILDDTITPDGDVSILDDTFRPR